MTQSMEMSMFNSTASSFYGFSSQEIYDNSMFEVIKNKKSFTLKSKDEEDFQKFLHHMNNQYGQYANKNYNGIMYKCQSLSNLPVTITMYPSTLVIHLQGMGSSEWLENLIKMLRIILLQNDSQLPPKQSTPVHRAPSPISIHDVSMINHPSHFPLSISEASSLDHNTQEMTPVSSTTSTSSSASTSHHINTPELTAINLDSHSDTISNEPITAKSSPNTTVIGTQTGETLSKYDKEMTSLKLANSDLSKNNRALQSRFEKLTEAYTQLANNHSEALHRLDLMTAEKDSLQAQLTDIFTEPKKTSQAPTIVQLPNISTSNSFSELQDQHTPQHNTDSEPSPPPPSRPPPRTKKTPTHHMTHHMTYADKRKSIQKQKIQQPPKQETKTPKESKTSPAQILIFSNSMCKRIREDRFHREKTTKVFAKGGATIADIQSLVQNSDESEAPEYVILQAWTNTTARMSFAESERMARRLIETALDKFPDAKIILSGVLPRFWDDKANQVAKQLNERFRYNCNLSQRVQFTDHTKSVLTDDGVVRKDLYWDDVHLNNKGLSRMVVNLRKTIDNWSKNSSWLKIQPKT